MLKKLDKMIESQINQVSQKSHSKAINHYENLIVKYKFIESKKTILKMEELRNKLFESKSTKPLLELRDKLFKSIGKSSFQFIGTIDKDTCYGIVSN